MSKNRVYTYSNAVMITTSKTIAENFKANIDELSMVRTDWTPEAADALIAKIDTVIDSVLGTDAQKNLRNATAVLAEIDAAAKRDLSFFKTQIVDDFAKTPEVITEMLNSLGFTSYLKSVQKGSQEAMTLLLAAFKQNMTDMVKDVIVQKGTNPALIEKIIAYADTYTQANVSQERMKHSSKSITADLVNELNAIYEQVIGICKKASKYYQYEPLKKEQFVFSRIAAKMGQAHKAVTEASHA